jgi:hypothetical protein
MLLVAPPISLRRNIADLRSSTTGTSSGALTTSRTVSILTYPSSLSGYHSSVLPLCFILHEQATSTGSTKAVLSTAILPTSTLTITSSSRSTTATCLMVHDETAYESRPGRRFMSAPCLWPTSCTCHMGVRCGQRGGVPDRRGRKMERCECSLA